MTGTESRDLMEAWAVDLLTDDEELRIAEHLEGCEPCKTHWDALSEVNVELNAMVDEDVRAALPTDVRETILAGALAAIEEGRAAPDEDAKKKKLEQAVLPAQPTPDAQALGIKVVLNCSYCHAPTSRIEVTFCATCLAPHHRECFTAHGRCSTIGCEETRTVRPLHPDLEEGGKPAETKPYRRSRRLWGGLGLVVLTGGAIAAFMPESTSPADLARIETERLAAEQAEAKRIAAERKVETFSKPTARLLDKLRDAVEKKDAALVDKTFADLRRLCDRLATEDPALREEADAIIAEAQAARGRLDLAAEREPLAAVVKRLSMASGRNIIVGTGVDETVTASLRSVTWQDALSTVARLAECRVEKAAGGTLILTQPPKVSVQYTDANVRTVISDLARRAERNVLISPEVRGSVTLDLKQVYWDEALLSIVYTVGDFELVQEGPTVVRVVTRSSVEQLGTWTPYRLNIWRAEPLPTVSVSDLYEGFMPAGPTQVSLEFTDAPVSEVVASLSKQAERPVSVDSNVDERISVSLKDEPWDHALRVIASRARCLVEVQGEVLLLTQQPRVSIQFTDANVRTVIQLLAAYSGKNIMISPEVRGNVTLDIRQAPWDAALKTIVQTVGEFQVRRSSPNVIRVITKSAAEQTSIGEPLKLPTYWSLLPDTYRKVQLKGPATAAEFCAQITEQTGCPIVATPGGPKIEAPYDSPTSWGYLLEIIARDSGLSMKKTERGFVLSRPEQNTLRAFQANVRTWLELLNALAETNMVMAPDVRGSVTTELEDSSYPDAFEAAVKACGFSSGDVEGVGWVRVGQRARRIGRGKTQVHAGVTLDGSSFSATLTGIALTPELRLAIVNDRIYHVGETVIDENTDEPVDGLVVAGVSRDGVLLQKGREAVWVKARRTESGEYASTLEALPPHHEATVTQLALQLNRSADGYASNELVMVELEKLGAKAIAPLLRLVKSGRSQTAGLIAQALVGVVNTSRPPASVRAEVRRAISLLSVNMHLSRETRVEAQTALKRLEK